MAGPTIVSEATTLECGACGGTHTVKLYQAYGGPVTYRCPDTNQAMNVGAVFASDEAEPEAESETPAPNAEFFTEPESE
jgi:hypothetical protein